MEYLGVFFYDKTPLKILHALFILGLPSFLNLYSNLFSYCNRG